MSSIYRSKKGIGLLSVAVLLLNIQPAIHAAEITLSDAFSYNAFVFEDYTGYYSDVEGSLAVGGNLTVNDFDVGLQLTPDLTTSSLYVGGDITYTNGKIRNGETIVNGNVVANNVEFEDTVNAAGNIMLTESAVLSGNVNAGGTFTSLNAEINNGDVNAVDVALTNTSIENGDINTSDANGDVSLVSSEVSNGTINAGNSISLDFNSSAVVSNSTQLNTSVDIENIDFDEIENEIKTQSSEFADMTTNGDTTLYCQGETDCADSSGIDGILFSGSESINVFNIDALALSAANKSITYDVSTTSYNIINVFGDSVNLFNTGFFNTAFEGQYLDNDQNADYRHDGTYTNNILFNFVDATSLTIQSIGVKGSVLAPYADVAFYNGHIDGNLIANNVYTPEVYLTNEIGDVYLAPTGQVNNYRFSVTQVSAPASFMILLPAFAAMFMRRNLKCKT